MNSKRIIPIIIALLITAIPAKAVSAQEENAAPAPADFQGQPIELTFEKAFDIMTKDNITIIQAKLDKEAAKINIDKNESTISDLNKIPGATKEGSINYNNIKLLKLANEYLGSNAERNYQATVAGLKASLEQIYYGTLNAMRMIEINQENLNNAILLDEKTKKKFELGLAVKKDILDSEYNVILAETKLDEAVNTLKKSKMLLNEKLGYDVMSNIQLKDRLNYEEIGDLNLEETVSNALGIRYEVKSVGFAYENEKINMDITAAKYPDITFAYKEQKVKLLEAEKNLQNIKRNIEIEIRSKYLDLIQKYKEIKAGEKSVQLGEEALKITQISYDAGMAVQTDVQKAQIALQQARLGLIQTELDYKMAYLEFMDSIGVGRIEAAGN